MGPQEMRDIKECISSFSTLIENTAVNKPSSSNGNNDFCEITDVEIKAVRDAKLKERITGNNIRNKQQNMSQEKRSKCKIKNIIDQIVTVCESKTDKGKTVCDSKMSTSPNI